MNVLNDIQVVHAINRLNNTINNQSDIKIAIISIIVVVIGIIIPSIINIVFSNNNNHTDKWCKLQRQHELKLMSIIGIRSFSNNIWIPFKTNCLFNKIMEGHLTSSDKQILARIIGAYRGWTVYLHHNVADVKFIKHILGNNLKLVSSVSKALGSMDKPDWNKFKESERKSEIYMMAHN